MRMLLALAILVFWSGLAQTQTSEEGKQVFDGAGHLTAYIYSDGSRDLYTYDSQWRIAEFTARNGTVARYQYNSHDTYHAL